MNKLIDTDELLKYAVGFENGSKFVSVDVINDMAKDLISKKEALAYPLSYDHYDKENGDIKFIHGVESYREYIEGLPTVGIERHGQWIDYQQGRWVYAKCSECEKLSNTKTPYCAYCGVKMDEEL